MKKRNLLISGAIIVIIAAVSRIVFEGRQTAEGTSPEYNLNGTVSVPAFNLPPSKYMSMEAKGLLMMRAMMPNGSFSPAGDIAQIRQEMEKTVSPLVKLMHVNYPADIVEKTIAGVRVREITPKDGDVTPDRILINLHGGAFSMCAEGCALLESLPIAALGKFKVISIDYRMAPEFTFPAANEDVAAVYQALLATYKPEQIGMYGCSAGGVLTGQMAAWLPKQGLPLPGAIGIFGAGAGGMGTGDSSYVAGYIDGSFPPPNAAGEIPALPYRSYFEGVDTDSPLVSPLLYPEVLTHFPPTLLITGTRAMDMSPAIVTHSELMKAGAKSSLIVGEGMGHCYVYISALPEARDAYRIIVNFFRDNLGQKF